MSYDYLVNHYKGKYRLKAKLDLDTNDFPRDVNGNLEYNDVYIDCYDDIEVHHYGGKTLKIYIPCDGLADWSKQLTTAKAKSRLQQIMDLDENIVEDYIESDGEGEVYIHEKDLERVFQAKIIKPKTQGANISPFSVRNLPKNKRKWNKYKPINKRNYNILVDTLKEWSLIQGVRIDKAYEKFYKDFGKTVKMNLIKISDKENYKPLHIIDKENLTEKAIEFLKG